MSRYGTCYKGSKSQIAEWVYSHFPRKDNFYDLFAGGCSITHVALVRSEFKKYVCNDIDSDGIQLFLSIRNTTNGTEHYSRDFFLDMFSNVRYTL